MTRVNPYFKENGQPGEEISSTFEGRHVLIQERELVHPQHDLGLNLVRKGDPVAFMDGVGVALKTAQAIDEPVPIDTEGIWRLSVTSYFFGVVVGQTLFIDGLGEINDDVLTAFTIFGYALEEVPAPENGSETAVIAVKVHWMWPWFYYIEIPENGGPR